MSKQTIDGVPGLRDLLDRVFSELPYASQDQREVKDELRALLDSTTHKESWSEDEDGFPVVSAAQPQGDPVAKLTRYRTLASGRMAACDQGFYVRYSDVQKLYAEQPAPVLIGLQRVMDAYDYACAHPHKYLRGTTNWCAAFAHSLNAVAK